MDGVFRRKQTWEHDSIDIHDPASPGGYRRSRLITGLSITHGKQGSGDRATDLTINAVQTKDYDRATALVPDAIELTARTETTLARQRLLALAATLPSTSTGDPFGVLRDQIMSTLRR